MCIRCGVHVVAWQYTPQTVLKCRGMKWSMLVFHTAPMCSCRVAYCCCQIKSSDLWSLYKRAVVRCFNHQVPQLLPLIGLTRVGSGGVVIRKAIFPRPEACKYSWLLRPQRGFPGRKEITASRLLKSPTDQKRGNRGREGYFRYGWAWTVEYIFLLSMI